MRLLLVEDNAVLADWLGRSLRRDGYTVDWLDNGNAADFCLRDETFDLVILDLALPQLGGHEVLRRLRGRGNATPVLVLTADNSLRSRIAELDQGADDYLAKPFEVEELEARIRVLLRRASGQTQPLVRCGGLVLNTNTREFTLGGAALALTPRERAVLEVLILKAGSTVSKLALAQSLFSLDEQVSPEAIEVYVHRLRKKLEPGDAAILTLRGLGYLMRPAAD